MPRPRGPEDRKPTDAPCFPEVGGTRWELPVCVDGAMGELVIRTFEVARRARAGLKFATFDTEVSIRGRLAAVLESERRKKP